MATRRTLMLCFGAMSGLVGEPFTPSAEAGDAPDAIIYVDAGAPDAGDGTAWSSAFRRLEDAITLAGSLADAEIRIAAGTYVPDGGRDAAFEFEVSARLTVLGGFPPGGGAVEDRDPLGFQVVLSGDALGDDATAFTFTAGPVYLNVGDNHFRVVSVSGTGHSTFDGLTISGGHSLQDAGGMFVGPVGLSLNDVVIESCSAASRGGGLLINPSAFDTRLEGVTLRWCTADRGGGAFINRPSEIGRGVFAENAASIGGGLLAWEPVAIDDSVFTRNVASSQGGGLILIGDGSVIQSCTFDENRSEFVAGGASVTGESTIRNCVFTSNSSESDTGGLRCESGPAVENTEFLMNSAGRANGAVEGAGSFIGCRFEGNSAGESGGVGFAAYFESCEFVGNTALYGGALRPVSGGTRVSDSVFRANTAMRGGAISGIQTPDTMMGRRLIDCERTVFVGNHADEFGGAVDFANAEIRSCQFMGNTAGLGGGAVADSIGWIENSTIVGNGAFLGGGVTSISPLEIRSCIVWGNTDATADTETAQVAGGPIGVRFSIIEGLSTLAGNGNGSDDPRFRDELGDDGLPWSGDEDLRLAADSPGIDAGHATGTPGTLLDPILDLAGRPRSVSFGGGAEGRLDIGAYEAQDCDGDARPDGTAISGGFAEDCNGDGVPDTCQLTLDGGQLIARTSLVSPPAEGLDTDGARLIISRDFEFAVYRRAGDAWEREGALPRPSFVHRTDFYGAVAVDDRRAVVGLRHLQTTLIYERAGTEWVLDETLPLSSDAPYSGGQFVDVDGDVVLTSDSRLRVYRHDGENWVNETTAPSAMLLGNESGNARLHGDRIVTRGASYIRQAFGGWVRIGPHVNPTTGEFFDATGMDLNDEFMLVAETFESDTGAAFLFPKTQFGWGDPIRLEPTDPRDAGPWGTHAVIDGDAVAIGAPRASTVETPNGYIELFERDGADWSPSGRLTDPRADTSGFFVRSMAARGGSLVFESVSSSSGLDPVDRGVFSTPLIAGDADGNGLLDSCEAPCTPADIAAPFGVLDLADVTAFVNAFVGADPIADLAPPGSVFDIADLVAFVESFLAGCP